MCGDGERRPRRGDWWWVRLWRHLFIERDAAQVRGLEGEAGVVDGDQAADAPDGRARERPVRIRRIRRRLYERPRPAPAGRRHRRAHAHRFS